MDTIPLPAQLPATVTRGRPLIEAVMAQSLSEQGPGSRTVSAWLWVLTGQGTSPVTQSPGRGKPPTTEEIVAETRYGSNTTPPRCGWPPWRYAFDSDLDRQQARRVLRWITGAADAIPLLDPARGRYVGARLHFARTDEELRRVRGWAHHGLQQHGELTAKIPPVPAERPWQWPSWQMNAAWLRGTIAYLDWILGDTPVTPLSRQHQPLDRAAILAEPYPRGDRGTWREVRGAGCGPGAYEEELMVWLADVTMQGHEGQPAAEPDRLPSPQWGEGVEQAHDWATGEDGKPPADHHGCGGYYPCPGDRRCLCEAAGYCLRGRCPACTDTICSVGWAAIVEKY